jgi:hypothetical protein
MFEYIDSSGNIITYDQITKMAKEGKTSFDAIVKKNGYKPKPKTTKVKSGAELLGIDTTAKKAAAVTPEKKKTPIVKKTEEVDAKLFETTPEESEAISKDFYKAKRDITNRISDSYLTERSTSALPELGISQKEVKAGIQNFNKKQREEEEAKQIEDDKKLATYGDKLGNKVWLTQEDLKKNEVGSLINSLNNPQGGLIALKQEYETSMNLLGVGTAEGKMVPDYSKMADGELIVNNLPKLQETWTIKNGEIAQQEDAKAGWDTKQKALINGKNFLSYDETELTKKMALLTTAKKNNNIAEVKRLEALIKKDRENLGLGSKIYDENTGKLLSIPEKEKFNKKQNEKAKELANTKSYNILNTAQTKTYYELLALAKTAAGMEGNIKETESTFEKMGTFIKDLIASDDDETNSSLTQDIKNLEYIVNNNELPKNLNQLPGKHPISLAFNKKLEQYITLTKAIELNNDPITTAKNSKAVDFIDQTSKAFFNKGVYSPTGYTNRKEVAKAFNEVIESIGYTYGNQDVLDKKVEETVADGALGATAHLIPLTVALLGTKKASGKQVELAGNAAKDFIKKAVGNSRSAKNATDIFVGGMKEVVYLGMADKVLETTTGGEPVDATFAASLGAGNVIAEKLIKKAITNKIPIVTPILAAIATRSNTVSKVAGIGVAATTGTAVMEVAEAATLIKDRLVADGKIDQAEEWANLSSKQHIASTFWSLALLGGFAPKGFYDAVKSDIQKIPLFDVESINAGKTLGIDGKIKVTNNNEIRKRNSEIDKAEKKAITELNKKYKGTEDFEAMAKEEVSIRKSANALRGDVEIQAIKLNKKAGLEMPGVADLWVATNKLKLNEKLSGEDIQALSVNPMSLISNQVGIKKGTPLYDVVKYYQGRAQEIGTKLDEIKIYENSPERNEIFKNTFDLEDSYRELNSLKQSAKSNPSMSSLIDTQIKELETKIENLGNKNLELVKSNQTRVERDFDIDIEAAKETAKAKGKEIITYDNEEAFINANKEITGKEIPEDIYLSGFFDPSTGNLHINPIAKEGKMAGTGSHESAHLVLENWMKDAKGNLTKEGVKFIEDWKNTLSPKELEVIEKRIEEGGYKTTTNENGELVPVPKNEYYEEYLAAFTESIREGRLNYSPKKLEEFKAKFETILKEAGIKNPKILPGNAGLKEMSDILKSLAETAKTGKASKKALEFSEKMDQGTTEKQNKGNVSYSKVKVEEVQKKIDNLEEQFDKGEIDYDDYTGRLEVFEKDLEKAKKLPEEVTKPAVKKEVTKKDTDKEIIKNEKANPVDEKKLGNEIDNFVGAKDANGKYKMTKEEWDAGGLLKAKEKLIDGKMLDPLIKKELTRNGVTADNVHGISVETFIEDVKDRLLEAALLKFNPEVNNSLGGFILGSQFGLKNKIGDVANKYKKQLSTSSIDVEAGGVSSVKELMSGEEADFEFETAGEAKEKPIYKDALESNVFEPKVLEEANKKILTVVRTMKARVDAPVSLNRTVSPFISELKDEMGRLLDIDIKTAMGGKKDGQLENWALKNKKYFLENMTTTFLMGKDGQGGVPQAIQKRIGGKWVSFPEWVGKKIDREATSTDQAGRTAGHELTRRLPNVANNVSDKVFLEQLIGPDGNPIRGRKESWAKAVAEEFALDIIKDDIKKNGPISEAIKYNQEVKGVPITEAFNNEILRQGERGNVKNAQTLKETFEKSQDYLNIAFEIFKNDLERPGVTGDETVKIISDFIRSPGRSIRTMAYRMFGEGFELTKNKKLFEYIKNAIDTSESPYKGEILDENHYRLKDVGKNQSIFFGEEKVPTWLDTESLKKNWPKLKPKAAEEALVATDELIDRLKSLKGQKYTEKNIEDYLKLISFDQRGLTRKVSKPGIAVEGITKKQKAYLEHNPPKYNIVRKAMDFYKGKITEQELRDFISNAKVNLVPEGLNDVLPKYVEGKNRMDDPAVVLYLKKLIDNGQKITGLESEYGSIKNFNAKVKLAESDVNSKENMANIDRIMAIDRSVRTKNSQVKKGISVFDFDDTVGLTKGSVLYTMPNGKKGKLNAEEFAKNGSKLLNEGAEFDFSEFSKVVGGKPGPMVEKMKKMIGKFGPDNFFILTARPADAAGPIHEFLSSIGIDIPIENITGLGNSTGKAKADWMVGKAAEGYNDFYFADDAPQNVKAVQDALDVLDVKSKIQQARLKYSQTMSTDFNRIIEEVKGVESYKVYSDITAKRKGANKNRFDFYVPPSAADFELLLYNFMGKGTQGEAHKKFFQDALIKPYINGVDLMDSVRQSIKKDYKALLKSFPEVKKELEKLTPNKNFTYDQAMRVAIWDQYGIEIPGLAARDKTYLSDLVNNNPELTAFKDGLIVMGRQKEGWLPPDNFWDSNTIVSDLYNITEGSGRKKFLGEFIENAENIFGKWEDGRLVGPNMNKVEATFGTNVREALEDSIYRMTNGKNRSFGQDKESAAWSSWVNGSTGSIMFLNTRSAALQMLGAVNFLNFRDNNPFAAAKAFANQPQYWKDFSRIWNSDKLKERRGGLREDVASAEIANAAAGSKNKVVAVTSYLLKIGYTPTQIADSFAIASGGAPFYRNRIKTYLKEGLPEVEAEAKAWEEFSKVSDETQQSGDPKDISKQQASSAGRILLVFQNFTMQQSRIVKKAALDLKNGRGDAKTNISKIVYYLAVQNIMFSALQQGLFAVAFDDDGDDKDKKKKTKEEVAMDLTNGVLDSILRGTGFVGGVAATLKNTIIKYFEEQAKKQKAEYAKVILEAANMSPPIGSKLRKTYSALQQTKYDKDLIAERGWGVMQDGRVHLGPMYSVSGKLVEATTNFPMDRLVNKVENVSQAFNSENTAVQRLATGMGYSPWTVGIEGTKGDILIKETAKAKRKEEGILKAKETRRENAERLKDSIEGLSPTERRAYRRKIALEKKERKIQRAKEKREEMRKRRKRRMGE